MKAAKKPGICWGFSMQHRATCGLVLKSERASCTEVLAILQTHATCKEEELLNAFSWKYTSLTLVLHGDQLNSWHKVVFWVPIQGSQFQAKKRDFQTRGKKEWRKEVKGTENRGNRQGSKEVTRRRRKEEKWKSSKKRDDEERKKKTWKLDSHSPDQ